MNPVMRAKKNVTRVAVTGGPGAGKTTLLQELGRLGHTIVPEVARCIIADRKASELSPRPEPLAFAQAIFDRDIEQYNLAAASAGVAFFDRSVLDSLAMLAEIGGVTPDELGAHLENYRYHHMAFILPPWRAIYRLDSERDQSYDEAFRVYEGLRNWYVTCGYRLIEVPPGPVEERCQFVLQALGPDAA